MQLEAALGDVEVLDEALKQFMDGDGRPLTPGLSWKRVSHAYLRPLVSRFGCPAGPQACRSHRGDLLQMIPHPQSARKCEFGTASAGWGFLGALGRTCTVMPERIGEKSCSSTLTETIFVASKEVFLQVEEHQPATVQIDSLFLIGL